MKVEKRKFSTRRRLNEARSRGAKRFYERWGGERDYYDYLIDSYHLDDYDDDDFYLDKYDKVYVYGITEDTPLVVFEDDKKYLAFCEYDTIGKIDPKVKEFFQITDPLNIRFFDLHEFPKDGVIDYNWMKTSARVETIIDVYKGDIDRLNGITVADGTPILEALKNLIVEGVEKAYDEGTAEEVYGTYYQHNAIQSDVPELKVDLFYKGELNGEYSKDMKESARKTRNKMKESARKGESMMKKSFKRRLNEARARGAKRFYEWDAAKDQAWLKAEDSYLDSLAGDLNKPDDGYLNYYDTVWVYGCTKNVPLVVFEGDKKYLASYEYETAGELNAKSKEMFQITDTFDIAAFDLYEFPKDGIIPDNWDKKKAVKVASIFDYYTDDIDRLDGITVADGTPVVEALKDLTIKGVEKAYNSGTAKERYNSYYDEVDLDVRLYYKGELNGKYGKGMKESVRKKTKRVKEFSKRRLNEARSRGAKRFYEGWREDYNSEVLRRSYDRYLDELAGDFNEPDDSYLEYYDAVLVCGFTKNVPLVVFEGNKKYLASYEYETAGELDAKAKEMFQITDAFDIISFDLYEFPKDGVIPTDWDEKKAVKVASIFEDSTDDADRLNGITVADGTPVVEALRDLTIKGVEEAYDDETAEEFCIDERYYNPQLSVRLCYEGELNEKSDKDMKESTEKPKKRVKESFRRRRVRERAEWYKKETFEIENDSYHPLRVLKDGKEYEGYYIFECTANYWGDDRDLDRVESQLEDYDLVFLELDDINGDDDIVIERDDVDTPEIEELLKSLTVAFRNNRTMSFLDFMKESVEDGVRDHEYDVRIDWDDWEGTPDLDDDY